MTAIDPESERRAGSAENLSEEARRTARALGEETASAAADVAREAKRQARRAADAGREEMGGSLERVVAALRVSAGELSGREAWLADTVESAADRLQAAAAHLHHEDVEGLADEACDFARRHPAMFLGGAVALGFALSRVAKAGRHGGEWRERTREDRTVYGDST